MTANDHAAAPIPVDPLTRRAIEVDVAQAFLGVLTERIGETAATEVLSEVVAGMAESAAATIRETTPDPTLADLWDVWSSLGGDGRLELHLDELSERTLRFRVDRCAYADLYRSRGQQDIGVAFSCCRDAPFARALVPGISVEQSTTLLEGAPRCEFTYRLEER
jgi:hypothetical protein